MLEGKHLLLVATTTGYQTRAFADVARRLGVRCTLATDRCHTLDDPWGDQAVAVRFEDPISGVSVLEQAGSFDGIVALGDRTTFLAALYAEKAGLAFHPPQATEAARSKFLSKELFRAAGLLQPSFARYPLGEDAASVAPAPSFPCVLKPLGLSGSRGVIRADTAGEFVAAFARIERMLRRDPEILRMKDPRDQFVQVESFIPGEEFAVEGIVTGGDLQVLALFDKPEPLNGPYFEETIYVTPSRQTEAVPEILRTVRRGVESLGLRHGPVHAEVRWNEQGVWILEIAARPIGGYCAKALRFEGGIGLEELILRHALGEDVGKLRLAAGASGVMMIPIPKAGVYEGVSGIERAKAVAGITDVLISAVPGQRLLMYPDASSYLGFLFASGCDPGAVEASLREAHASLEFTIMTALA